MPVTIIVEDGSGVPNANSYVDVADVTTYAAQRGITLSSDPDVVGSQLILACDFLESYDTQYVGQRVNFSQALSWPRKCVSFDLDTPYPDNEIPTQLIKAQCEAVLSQFNGLTLQPDIDYSGGGYVIDEKVDVIETKYSERIGTTGQPVLTKVWSLLITLLNPGVALRNVRI